MGRVTVTIHIDYPDGSGVSVVEAQAAPHALPVHEPELEDAPWPTGVVVAPAAFDGCPVHHMAWKVVPAGISKKTGKPYDSFRSCPTQGCNERPR